MSKIDYQALREKAEKATKGSYIVGHTSVNQHGNITGVFVCQKWKGEPGGVIAECHVNCLVETDVQAYANAEFIAAFNPNVALALLDERERNQQYIKRRDQENEDIALTVGRLRVELEGKDSKIANLTAERDALREGEMGDARHSNTRAAADIYFQLVEECEIPAGGSLVEYVDDMREKLEAAEKRIAELESGSQAQKLVEAIIVAIENEQERLFDEDYLMDSKECIDVIREEVKRWNDSRAAGIRINGGE
ncbi:TPA: ead/Ea22-like family protein [Escherichia coli]